MSKRGLEEESSSTTNTTTTTTTTGSSSDGNYIWSTSKIPGATSSTASLIQITELLQDQEQEKEREQTDEQGQQQDQEQQDQKEDSHKYIVEEPFDYIFEPSHQPIDQLTTQPRDSHSTVDMKDAGFKFARSIRETDDGVLEYEYRSYRLKGSSLCGDDDEHQHQEMRTDDESSSTISNTNNYCQNLCEHDLMNESHLSRSNFRSISMIKWPQVGFGVELGKQTLGDDETFFYVNRVFSDSPAEFSLQPGDILLELDEITLADGLFAGVDQINNYLEQHESVHMIVAHESKYFKIKSENADLLKESQLTCEDIVIVSLKNIS